MSVISAPDLVLLRTSVNKVTPYLSVLQPVALLTALVNNGSAARGMRTIAYDTGSGSGFATIEAGQTLEVDTADGTFRTRIKSVTSGNQSAGVLEIDENPISWLNNQVIRVIHSYDIQPIPPVIRGQVFMKFYDDIYVLQNEEPPPVAIIGSHLAGFLSAGSIVFQLNSSSSYAIANGATISSRVWSCVHMGGGTTGITFSSTTTANPTITLTVAGQYWLKCIVTDSNGKTQSTYRAIFIYDASNLPYKNFSIQSLTGDWSSGGWRASIVPFGDVTLADFPDRTLCLLWYVGHFGATETYVDLWDINADNVIMGGYIRQDNDTDQFNTGTGNVSFDVTTPESVLDNISELGSVSLNAVANPDVWYEYASWMTTGRSIHHLVKYHSYGILQVWDVLGLTDDSRGVLNTDFTEGSLLQQINGLAFSRGIYAKMICDRFGRLHLVKDSNILNTANRAALDTVMTILEADISSVVSVVREPEENVTFGELNGFSFDGATSTPFISILPGYRESSVSYIMPNLRGSGTLSIGNQILSSQTDSNVRIGRVLAQINNNPREIRFSTPYNGIGAFDIVDSIGWYEWGIADNVLKRDTDLNAMLLICRSITHTFNHQTGIVTTELAFEPEAHGPDGIQGNYPTSYPNPAIPTPDWTPPDDFHDIIFTYRDNVDGFGKAFIAQAGSVTAGTIATFESASTTYTSVCVLSATQALVCYNDAGNAGAGTACILDISGTTITPATPAVFDASNSTYIDVCALSSTQALVVWRDAGNSNRGTACILDISGSTITPGTAAVFETGATLYMSVAPLSATKAIVAYADAGNSSYGTACVLDVSGSTITPATPAVWHSAAIGPTACAVLSSDSVVITAELIASNNLIGIVLSGITTTFTIGSPNTLDSINKCFDNFTPGNHWLCATSATNCICAYQSTGASPTPFYIMAHNFTIDGSLIPQPGTPLAVSSLSNGYDECATVGLVSVTKALVFYGDATAAGKALSIDFTGGTVTNNADEITKGVFPQYTSSARLV